MPEELQCTVVSIVPFDILEEKPGLVAGRYFIPASDGKEPQLLYISRAIHYVYLDETRGSLQVRDAPDEVARSIVEDFTNSQLRISENAKPGIFWKSGSISKETVKTQFKDDLDKARIKQFNWFVELCKLADDDWNRYHLHNCVTDFQRKAAEIIGWRPEEHEWMAARTVLGGNRCPSCQTLVAPNVIVCPSCSCILDHEKYSKLQFAGKG